MVGGRGIAIRSQRQDEVGVEIHDRNASCELFADRQLVKHKKPAYAYHSLSLYATSCSVTHTIFQVTWTQQYRPLTPPASYILQVPTVLLRRWAGRRSLHEERTTLDGVLRGPRYILGAAQTLVVDVPALSIRYSHWDALHIAFRRRTHRLEGRLRVREAERSLPAPAISQPR